MNVDSKINNEKDMYDMISIGDTTVDVFLELNEAEVTCDIDKDNCKLSINYADKIPVDGITEVLAVGNSANNAVASSKFGMKTALYTHLGDDASGKAMKEKLIADGISDEYLVIDEGKRSNHSTVINYQGERTILVYHEPRTYQLPDLADTKWIYFSSIGKGRKQLHDQVVARVENSDIKLGFNPGSHQMKDGAEALAPIISKTHVFFVNVMEAERLFGEADDIKGLLKKTHDAGPEIVVITDGPQGSFMYDGQDYWRMGIIDVPVIERTGCGDAYASGFIAALHYGKSPDEAMQWGNMNSTFVLQKIGAQAGLLSYEKMLENLAKHEDVTPEKF